MIRSSFLFFLVIFLAGCASVEIVGGQPLNEPLYGTEPGISIDSDKFVIANVVVDDRLIYPYDSYSNTKAFVAISHGRAELMARMEENGTRFLDETDTVYNLFSVYYGPLHRYRPQYYTQFYMGSEKGKIQRYFKKEIGDVDSEAEVAVVLSNRGWWVSQMSDVLPPDVEYIGLVEIGLSRYLPYSWNSSVSVSKDTNRSGELLDSYHPQITIGVFDAEGSFVLAHRTLVDHDELRNSDKLYAKVADLMSAAGIR